MLHPQVIAGSVDQSVYVRFLNTDGTPATGVVWNSAGMNTWYRRAGGLVVPIVEATLAAADTAHADGGLIHLGAGLVRLDLPDAAVASGAANVLIGGEATGMVMVPALVPIVEPGILKRNTPLANFEFMMFDSNEEPLPGITPVVERVIDNGAFSTGTISGIAEIGGGWYRCNFAAADRNGTTIGVRFSGPGAMTHGFTWTMEP